MTEVKKGVSLKDKIEARKKLDEMAAAEKEAKLETKTAEVAANKAPKAKPESDDTEAGERDYKWLYPDGIKGDPAKMKKFRAKHRKEIRNLRQKAHKAESALAKLQDAAAPATEIEKANAEFTKLNTEFTELCNAVLPDPSKGKTL